MTAVDRWRSTAPTVGPTTLPREPRRGAGRFLLDVLDGLGRRPSVWDPWLLLIPYRARTMRRIRRSPR